MSTASVKMHHRCRAGGVHLYLSAWSLLRGLLSLGDACLAAGGGGGGGAPRHGSLECARPTTYSSAYLHSGHTNVCTPTSSNLNSNTTSLAGLIWDLHAVSCPYACRQHCVVVLHTHSDSTRGLHSWLCHAVPGALVHLCPATHTCFAMAKVQSS